MPRRPIPPHSVYRWTKYERELFLDALFRGVGIFDYHGISAHMHGVKSSREVGVYRRWWSRRNPELYIRLRNEDRRRKREAPLKDQLLRLLRTDETLDIEFDQPFGPALERLFSLPELDYYSDLAV